MRLRLLAVLCVVVFLLVACRSGDSTAIKSDVDNAKVEIVRTIHEECG